MNSGTSSKGGASEAPKDQKSSEDLSGASPTCKTPQPAPAKRADAKPFEEFDLDDVDVIESKIFA